MDLLPTRPTTQERDAISEQLQKAFSDGRLTEIEYSERMGQALGVLSRRELQNLVADLTVAPKIGHAFALLGGTQRNGRFTVAEQYKVVAVLGGCELDFSYAAFTSHKTVIRVIAILGGVQITVPAGMRIEMEGIPLLGGCSNQVLQDDLPPDAPVIAIRCLAILGGIEVRSRNGKLFSIHNGQ